MKRTFSTLLAIILMVGLIFVPVAMPASASFTTYDFTHTLAPWLPGSDFGQINKQSLVHSPLPSPVCSSDDTISYGYASLMNYTVPEANEGSWMVTSVQAAGPTSIEMHWKSSSDIQLPDLCPKGCDIVAYIGTEVPVDSSEFTEIGDLPVQWKDYQYIKSLDARGTVYIAIGWRSHFAMQTSGVLKPASLYEMAVNVDCVSVDVSSLTVIK